MPVQWCIQAAISLTLGSHCTCQADKWIDWKNLWNRCSQTAALSCFVKVPTLSYKASEPKLLSKGFGAEGSVQSTDFGCPADGTFFREHAVFKAACLRWSVTIRSNHPRCFRSFVAPEELSSKLIGYLFFTGDLSGGCFFWVRFHLQSGWWLINGYLISVIFNWWLISGY